MIKKNNNMADHFSVLKRKANGYFVIKVGRYFESINHLSRLMLSIIWAAITAKNTLNWNEQSKQKWFSDGLQKEIIGFEMELSKYWRLSVLLGSNSVKNEMGWIVLKWFRRRCWNGADYFKSVYSTENPSVNEMWNDQVWQQMV